MVARNDLSRSVVKKANDDVNTGMPGSRRLFKKSSRIRASEGCVFPLPARIILQPTRRSAILHPRRDANSPKTCMPCSHSVLTTELCLRHAQDEKAAPPFRRDLEGFGGMLCRDIRGGTSLCFACRELLVPAAWRVCLGATHRADDGREGAERTRGGE